MILQACVPCAPGFYNEDVNSTCKQCPVGAVCSGGASIGARMDYWRDPIDMNFYACDTTGVCCPEVCVCPRLYVHSPA